MNSGPSFVSDRRRLLKFGTIIGLAAASGATLSGGVSASARKSGDLPNEGRQLDHSDLCCRMSSLMLLNSSSLE